MGANPTGQPVAPAASDRSDGGGDKSVRRDDTPFVVTDGNREYDFGRFSILVTNPPPWLDGQR